MADGLTWLLVGTGDIVKKRVGAALSTNGQRLLGVVGGGGRAAAIAQQFGAADHDADLDEALRTTKAQAVYIATPVYRHVAQASAALRAGKHVLVEKPLALTADAARDLAAEAAAAPKLVNACAYYRRCSPRFAHARSLLAGGSLGKIIAVHMACHSWWAPAAGDPKLWRVDPKLSGGGPLADVGCHMLDVTIGLLGMPQRVSARTATLAHSYAAEDTATCLLSMPGGAQVSGSFSWASKSWAHSMEIIGTEGRLRWSPYDSGKVQVVIGRETRELDLPPADNVHQPLVDNFTAAVREQRAAACPIAEALRTNAVLDAIYQSAGSAQDVLL